MQVALIKRCQGYNPFCLPFLIGWYFLMTVSSINNKQADLIIPSKCHNLNMIQVTRSKEKKWKIGSWESLLCVWKNITTPGLTMKLSPFLTNVWIFWILKQLFRLIIFNDITEWNKKLFQKENIEKTEILKRIICWSLRSFH